MPYDEAVEEALCFGWIDSIVKSIDDQTYAQKFTPRKPNSKWSASNVERVKKMIACGQMTAAGLALFEGHESRLIAPQPATLSADLEKQFKSNKTAWKNFSAFPPGYRRLAVAWIASAKRSETQLKRLEAVIEASKRGERIKLI